MYFLRGGLVNNKELKVKSFRVDEETFSKFKDIASKEFGNQAQCLEALINIYETEESKSILVNRELEIESFQDYLNKISRLFITSLQLSTDAEERAKSTFLRKIESKDEALIMMKNKVDELKIESKELMNKDKKNQQEILELKKKQEELDKSKNTLTQLVNRNNDLANRYKSELDEIKESKAIFVELEKKFNQSTVEKNKLELENEALKQEILKMSNENENLLIKNKECDNTLKEKVEELTSYKMLIEALKRDTRAEILANRNKDREEFEIALKERTELIKRGFELDKKELELKLRELKIK